MKTVVRVRFAPSPTGFLHIGGVRTALFNYLFAKKNNGTFILRLEDTDRERFVEEGIKQIVESLDWLGLKPDEGFWISSGKHQNIDYIQSERQKTGIYQKYTDQFIQSGLAYRDWTTEEQLSKLRNKSKQTKRPFIFRKSMAKTDGDITKPHVIRFDVLEQLERDKKNGLITKKNGHEVIEWQEIVRGWLHTRYVDVDDFILIKSDGFPTYNLANVVDDHDMRISHVLRGDEFIASAAKHRILYYALGLKEEAIPRFVHLPVINGIDGKKLSKRTGDTNVLDYKQRGYLPEALVNFLALLGWNDGTTKEIYNWDELIRSFSLERIQKSPATFDSKRLAWINGSHIRRISIEDLTKRAEPFLPETAHKISQIYKQQVLSTVQERLKRLDEIPELTHFFFKEPKITKEQLIGRMDQKIDLNTARRYLESIIVSLEECKFGKLALEATLNDLLKQLNTKPASLFSLIRVAITGEEISPGILETLEVLGKDTVLQRLKKVMDTL